MRKGWLLLAATLAACESSPPPRQDRAAPPDWRTMSASRAYADEKALRADIEYGAGTLELGPGAPGTLYRATMRYERTRLTPRIDYADGVLHVGIEGGHVRNVKGGQMGRLQLELAPEVPLDLDVKFGAGEGTLELGGLTVQSARIATGASQTELRISRPTSGECRNLELHVGAARMTVTGLGNLSPERLALDGGVGDLSLDFSGAWRNDIAATINMGMGKLRLNVPRDVGLRVDKSSLLTSFDAANMTKQGDSYVSTGYQSAKRHLDVNLDAAFGSVSVHWLDGQGSF